MDGLDTVAVMAAFRQAARGRGWVDRKQMLRDVAALLGYQRLGRRIGISLKGHLRAALRRGILERDGNFVRALTVTMDDYTLAALRSTLIAVMRKGSTYDREDVLRAAATHLGFTRLTEGTRQTLKSALNSALRRKLLGAERNLIWREA